MSQTASGRPRAEKWYSMNVFPLVPLVEYRKKDKYNTATFTFRWLFFTLWSLDTVQVEFALTADTHWGIGFKGMLPYLRWVVSIPVPTRLGMWFDVVTNRNRWS